MRATSNPKHKLYLTKFHLVVNKKLKKRNIPKKIFVEKLQISQSHLYRVLQGERKSYRIAKSICDFLKLSYSVYDGLDEYLERCELAGKQPGQRTLPNTFSSKQSISVNIR